MSLIVRAIPDHFPHHPLTTSLPRTPAFTTTLLPKEEIRLQKREEECTLGVAWLASHGAASGIHVLYPCRA